MMMISPKPQGAALHGNCETEQLPASSSEVQAQGAAAMAKLILRFLKCIVLCSPVLAVFEDQVGKFDW